MSLAFSFISLNQSIILESQNELSTVVGNFLLLFDHECNFDKYQIAIVQKNTTELKDKTDSFLKKWGKSYPALNGIKVFLKKIPIENSFLIIKGAVDDTEKMTMYFRFLVDYHLKKGINTHCTQHSFDFGEILKDYNISIFGHQRVTIGDGQLKEKRICRFCKTENDRVNSFGSVVSFRKKAHAFSEALGNKKVILQNECDACNDRFSKTIEPSLVTYLSIFRSLYGLKGKYGAKKVVGENFSFDPMDGFKIQYDGILENEEELANLEMTLNLRETFVPQNIYKCLVKFVLSVMNKEDCYLFSKTIDWINGDFNTDDLPPMSFVQHSTFYTDESILIFFKKKSDRELPYMIGEFHYADLVFVFIIPFCEMDTITYTDINMYKSFWNDFNKVREQHKWNEVFFTSINPVKILIDLKIENVPPLPQFAN